MKDDGYDIKFVCDVCVRDILCIILRQSNLQKKTCISVTCKECNSVFKKDVYGDFLLGTMSDDSLFEYMDSPSEDIVNITTRKK